MCRILRFFILLLFISSQSCNWSLVDIQNQDATEPTYLAAKGALVSTRFKSLEELKKVIQIEYAIHKKPLVRLTHSNNGEEVISILQTGISEKDFTHARDGSFWDRVWLGLNSPYFVINRKDLLRVFTLARRKDRVFGAGDVAFYDLAETMVHNISDDDLAFIHSEDLSEKGFINTFNHITAQAFMTSIFSKKLADFVADTHERSNIPELVTGKFTEDQLLDLEYGPIDNYVDLINNEWGQELGAHLKKKYNINRETYWTPELLRNYLNDVQRYYSWVLQIGFKPFRVADEVVIRFSNKINSVMEDVSRLR
ncbi:MAG: hypothetical protein ACI81W_000947 [Saprospiraceae bacterium]|jgi:hypothetical protein